MLVNRILSTVPATWVSPKPNDARSTRAPTVPLTMSRAERARPGRSSWPAGPPTEHVAELVRTLELTINRRLDGVLHGNYQGITPGHGSEPGEARLYQPGDDVRRIDWNVTARTQETHVRDQIADRDLEAWLVVDTSAAMRFGTTAADKAQVALAAAAASGSSPPATRTASAPCWSPDRTSRCCRPGSGATRCGRSSARSASPPPSEGLGRSDLAGAHRPGRASSAGAVASSP